MAPPAHRELHPWAGVLSYLVPGLGQICQGRLSKGLFFLVSLYGLFFVGMYLDDWKAVYIPDARHNAGKLPNWVNNLINRPQFLGQFWIGVAVWPAIYHYNQTPPRDEPAGSFWQQLEQAPKEDEINQLIRDSDKTWDLGWVYTVIAGVLNVLVIYDAFAGPAMASAEAEVNPRREGGVPA
jgi:hypothetical protein